MNSPSTEQHKAALDVAHDIYLDIQVDPYDLTQRGALEAIISAYLSALPEQTGDLSRADLRAANAARQIEWCQDVLPDLSFRGNELAGETGEAIDAALDLLGLVSRLGSLAGRASNGIKKLERERHGWRGSRASVVDLGDELADVVICADLCAITAGIDLAAAVRTKFNATSDKNGLSTRLPATPAGEAS